MPEGPRGKSRRSGRAPAGARSCRFETSRGTPDCVYLFFQRRGGYAIRGAIRRAVALLVRGYLSPLLQRITPFAPTADSAVHRDDVGVSHFLPGFRGPRRTDTPHTQKKQ